jgi:predicted ATPase
VVPPTPLFGREEDLAAVTSLFTESGARLVTLVGAGGVGKTRLAAAASVTLAPTFPDGVVQVSLAPLSDARDLVPTVGRALGMAVTDGPHPDVVLDAVAGHVGSSRVLLVLDNFEHLLSAAASVGRLIALCPGLSVLVSSRSPLRVRVEQEYVVQPLALPSRAPGSAEELASAPAGALVLDRASAVAPQLAAGLTEDDEALQALAELCHRLSGIPLAIELATARLRMLTPAALLERLDEAINASGARDLPERQRTMRAALDWSYGLLTVEQQRLFTVLGSFRGGASLASVEAVASAGDDLAQESVLALLEELVEQSLVVTRPGVDGSVRFHLLEPVAQYARSLLVGDRAARIGRAHAATFLDLAERAAHGYERADQVAWLGRTEADEANILVAVDRSLDLGDVDVAGRIVWPMWLYWWLRGRFAVGRRLAERCLDHAPSPEVLPCVRLTAATMSYAGGDHAAASRHWEIADALAVELGSPELIAKARAGTGLAALGDGDLVGAQDRFRSALEHGERAGEAGVWIRSLTQVWLGTALLLQGEPAAAVPQIDRGLELARARGDRLSTYVALYNLSQAALALDEDDTARRHVEEGVALSGQTRDLANLAFFLETLAVVESRAGRHDRVATLLGAAAGLRESVGSSVYGYYLPDESLRISAEQAAQAALGTEAYDAAVAAGRGLGLDELVAAVPSDRGH